LLLFVAAGSLLCLGAAIGLVIGVLAGAGGPGKTPLLEETIEGKGKEKIAAIWLEGVLAHTGTGMTGGGKSVVERTVRQLKQAEKDQNVRGVILVISSPGGTVTASDILYDRVRLLRNKGKKVVTIVRDLAASGGYYVAAASDHILCHPTSLTGSIGVILPHLDLSRLIDEKLLITYKPVKSTEKKDMLSMARPMTAEERAILQALVKDSHDRFVQIVADGRGMPEDKARGLADGRIYTATQSVESGLVDGTGYFRDAVAKARSLCGTPQARIIKYRKLPGIVDLLLSVKAARAGGVLDGLLPGVPMYLYAPGLPVDLARWGRRVVAE
jgi:protease-4